MSLPWPEHLTVLLSPERVSVLRQQRSWRASPVQRIDVDCAPGAPALSIPVALGEALAVLQAKVAPRRLAQRPQARLLLSHRLAPLSLVAQARALRNDEERRAAARYAFAAVYGAGTADWQIVVDACTADTALAAGLDGPLCEGLRRTLAEARVGLRAIEPLIATAVVGAAAQALRAGPAWLAIVEPQQVVLARHEAGVWRSLRTHRPRRALAEDLGAWLQQARLIDGIDGPDALLVLASEAQALDDLQQPGWRVQQLALGDGQGVFFP